MASWSILLRVLLSLVLVLNGTGYAVASAGMPQAHEQAPSALHKPGPQVMAACEQQGAHAERGSATDTESAVPTGSDHATACPGHDAPECCQSDACRCACVQQMPLLASLDLARGFSLPHRSDVRPVPLEHDSPARSHLIRPPIG